MASLLKTGTNTGVQEHGSQSGLAASVLADAGIEGSVLTESLTGPAMEPSEQAALRAVEAAMTRAIKNEATLNSWVHWMKCEQAMAAIDAENRRASRSTIEDADVAAEQMECIKLQVLQQTALAMLAQGNASPSSVLRAMDSGAPSGRSTRAPETDWREKGLPHAFAAQGGSER